MTNISKKRINVSKSKKSKKSIKTKSQSGGKKYKPMLCSQSIVNLPRMDCLEKHCTGTKNI